MKENNKTYTTMYEVKKGNTDFPTRFGDLVKALNRQIRLEKLDKINLTSMNKKIRKKKLKYVILVKVLALIKILKLLVTTVMVKVQLK